MPKFKTRLTERGNWDETKMKQAVLCVKDKKLSLREASNRYGVPRSTLQDRVKGLNSGQEVEFKPKLPSQKPSKENPALLILDGHGSHKELAVIEYARANNIHMLSTPPHTTHKLQPLDRVFFKPFKAAFASESGLWMRINPGARITDYDIAGLVNKAFSKAARLEIAQNGFKCSGIYPFNRDIFSDLDFLPSAMTNIEQEPVLIENSPCNATSEISQPSTSRIQQPSTSLISNQSTNDNSDPHLSTDATSQPSTSHQQPSIRCNTADQLLKQLSPIPNASKKRLLTRSRKTQKSEILTSSPFKNALVEKHADAPNKPKATVNKKKATTDKGKAATASKKKMTTKQSIQSLTRDQGTECIICGETFEEDWIQCNKCKDWAHEDCVDIDPSQPYYYCDVCKAMERFGHH